MFVIFSPESAKLDEAAALPAGGDSRVKQEETDAAIAAAVDATINGGLDIDEDLFDGDDIDLVEEDLETLELEDETSWWLLTHLSLSLSHFALSILSPSPPRVCT